MSLFRFGLIVSFSLDEFKRILIIGFVQSGLVCYLKSLNSMPSFNLGSLYMYLILLCVYQFTWGYEVHVFGQSHYTEGAEKDKKAIVDIALSQFEILSELSKHKNSVVFTESLYEDISISDLDPEYVLTTRALFPTGIPSDFSGLSEAQIEFLGRNRAPQIAVAFGFINRIYKTWTKKQATENKIQVKSYVEIGKKKYSYGFLWLLDNIPEFRKLVTTDREQYAINNIADFVSSDKYRGQKIVLIFGKAHNFQQYTTDEVIFSNGFKSLKSNSCERFYKK